MIIGIDMDNTIVDYDPVLRGLATGRFGLPNHLDDIRELIKRNISNESWTELQGEIYGSLIYHCKPHRGFDVFLRECRIRDISIAVISHKTKRPYSGYPYDLHKAARTWLLNYGIRDEEIYLEESVRNKVRRIFSVGCGAFIDDNEGIISDIDKYTKAFHFKPSKNRGWMMALDYFLDDMVEHNASN